MSTRTMGPGAGWSWLARAVNLGRNNPRAVIGAVAIVAALALVPSIVQVAGQRLLGAEGMVVVAALATLVSVIVFPLLIGGVLRVIDAAERGRPVAAMAVFEPFRGGQGGGRLVGFGLLMSAIYLLVFAILVATVGQGLPEWYAQMMQLQVEAAGRPIQPDDLPDPPPGLGRLLGLGMLLGMFLGGAYAIGFGQVALGGRGVLEAMRDGVTGALRNLLPIAVLAVLSVAAMFVLFLVLVLVGGLLGLVGGLVHPALGVLLVAPLYFGLILLMYVVMFGVMYHMWRDVCGAPAAPPPLPANQVEL
ncbi:hypothetical protein L599_000200000350 [Luteimonas sp. J16]|jgi:hypothetical protein|uniref:hypothetical protein n=1 Tax=unclassified Luteimonas TaxID=2629088 RepID=UPI0011A0EE5A|nr:MULTISPECIES: hypothetical protein [unclassified Luteimonas]TWG92163.1 hypothetical protein L599_000200000350 [Luteimonas sp. J16]